MHISNVRISKPNIPQQLQSVAEVYHYPIPRITIARDGRKILFVLDRTAKENLDGWQGPRYAGVFHPEHEIVVSNILNHVMKQGDYEVKECLFLNYPTFYVADKHLYSKHRHLFAERLTEIIGKYKPDCVVFCGIPSYVDFIKYTTTQQNTRYIKGHVSRVWDWQHKEHPEIKCQMVGTVSLHQIASQQSDEMAVFPNLIGYFCASVIRAFTGVNEYTIDVDDSKFIYVDTIEKFDRFLPKLLEAQIVAIDTEGRSLARTVNEVYSAQFSFDGVKAYFVPLYHPKTPFTDKELEYVSAKLRHYFEYGKSKYHIYHNAKFDITVLKIPVKSLGVRHYNHCVYDTISGAYCWLPTTFVKTEIGPLQIKDLVAMHTPPKVLSYNHSTDALEYKDVINQSEHKTDKRMVEIEYEGGSITVTEDHEVWSETRKSYIEAKDINPDEEILICDV